jgi:hypothetical protein
MTAREMEDSGNISTFREIAINCIIFECEAPFEICCRKGPTLNTFSTPTETNLVEAKISEKVLAHHLQ